MWTGLIAAQDLLSTQRSDSPVWIFPSFCWFTVMFFDSMSARCCSSSCDTSSPSEPCSLILQLHCFIDVILFFILSPLLLSPQVSAVSPPQADHTSTNFSLTRHSNLEFSCSFVVMTMHSFNLILDLCLLLLMIFHLLGQSILLFTATDIIKQRPCTSASIIFFSSLLTNFSPNSEQVGVSTSHLILVRLSPHTSPTRRFVGL